MSEPSLNPETPSRPSLPYSSDLTNSSNAMRHYVGVLRRRWRWIAAGLVFGMLGGLLSTYIGTTRVETGAYYKATTTVIDSGSGNLDVNLQQAAFLLQSSEVQEAIATKLGVPVGAIYGTLAASAKGDVSAIDVTAISTDPAQVARVADTAAAVLVDYVGKSARDQYTQERDAIIKKLDELKAQRDELEAQIRATPAQAPILRAQVDSIVNQYRVTYEQLQSLAGRGVPSVNFTTVQSAIPIQINARAFRDRANAIVNARGSIQTATTPSRQSYVETDLGVITTTSRVTRVLLGGLVGMILGVASAFIIEVWDDRLRRRDRVELVTGLPVIAEVPVLPRSERQANSISVLDAPRSRASERYRSIRTTILFALDARFRSSADSESESAVPTAGDDLAPVILVTSPSPGEGKTTTTANIAAVFADSGARTLVVDCDYRKPSIGRYMQPVPNPERPEFPQRTRERDLWFVPAPTGGSSPSETIARLRQEIATWRKYFDIVLLDTPPMLTTNDATDLLDAADNVILVVRSNQTRTSPAERVASLLGRFGADVIGVVLNSCSASDMDSYYGYYYYYGGSGSRGYYGNPTPRDPAPPAVPASSAGGTSGS